MQIYNNNFVVPNVNNFKDNANSNIAKSSNTGFADVLADKIKTNEVQFSKHASMRLNNRNIALSNEQIKRIENGVEMANKKGINDSLVLVDNVALVVNIKNRVVITAMEQDSCNDSVFTNIDGAVIV